MPPAAIFAIGLGLVAVHLRAPFRVSLTALVVTTFLIPGSLHFPSAPGNVTVVRVALWAAALGLYVRATRGEVPAWSLRPSRLLVAVGFLVVLAYVFGVALAPDPSRPAVAFDIWLSVLDQFLFLWVVTAGVRMMGAPRVARIVVAAVVVAACIAISERFTHASYARFWFEGSRSLVTAAQRLETRGGSFRVRGAADFALEFAWVLAYFVPMLALYALRAKRIVALALPGVVAIAIVFTVTRSVFAGLAVGGVMLLLTARGDRRVLAGLGVAGVLALGIYAGAGGVRQPYQGADPESEKSRERRLVLVTQEMAAKPWVGLGLDGLIQRGVRTTDSAWLGTYGAVGVVGVIALGGAVVAAVGTTAYGAVRGDPELAPLAGATLGGLGAGVLGMFAFDTFSAPISAWNFWLLGALGVGLYEEARARAGPVAPRPLRFSLDRLVIPVAGLTLGAALFTFGPTHRAVDVRFFSLSSRYLSASRKANDDYIGRILVQTVCDVGTRAVGPDVRVDCFDPLRLGPGTGVARIETDDAKSLRRAFFRFVEAARRVPNTQLIVTNRSGQARPTWVRTAPVAGLFIGVLLALLLPAFRLGRRRAFGEAAGS